MGNGPPETGRGAGRRGTRRSACCSLRGCCRVQGSGALPQPTQRVGAEPRAGLGQRAGLALGCLLQVPWVQGPELQQELSPDPQPSGEGWFLSWGPERCCPCTPALMLGPSAPHPHPAPAMLSLLPCSAPSPPHRRPCSPLLSHTCPCIPWPRSTSTTASHGPDLVPCASPLLHPAALTRSPRCPGGSTHPRHTSPPWWAARGPWPALQRTAGTRGSCRFLPPRSPGHVRLIGLCKPPLPQRPAGCCGTRPTALHPHGAPTRSPLPPRCPEGTGAARGAMGCLPRPCCSTQSPPAEHCPWQ